MADRTFANITDTLVKLFYDDITSSINRAIVLAQLLEVKNANGQNIQWGAKFGTSVGASIADGADVSTYNSDDKVPAVLQYGTYHDAFAITGKAAAAAAAAGNPAQLADLFADELMDSASRLARVIGGDVYTGAGTTNLIHGLTATAGPLDTTGTYAGIARGTYTQWAANEVDAASAGLSFSLMRAARRSIYEASGEKPDLIICDAAQHEKYGALFGSERRYVDQIRMRGETIKLDGGYQVLEFDGIPVVEDAQAPAQTMMFLNTRYLYMSQLPDPSTMLNQSMGNLQLAGTNEEQFGDSPIKLTARILPLAKTGDKYKFALYCYPQLVARKCNVHGSIINLAA